MLMLLAGLALLAAEFAAPALAQGASAVLTARDQGNGEVLLEWKPQPNAASYRVERTASGIPTVSLEAGSHLNVMDFAGIAPIYNYRLMARAAGSTEREVARVSYQAPAYVLSHVTQAAARPPQLRSALGTNLGGITYYATQVPFVDMMKSARNWISGDGTHWDNQNPLDLDADGWVRSLAPGQVARTMSGSQLAGESGNRFPAGQYLVRYKGEGTLNFGSAASVVEGSQKPGKLLIQVTPSLGVIQIHISATNPANYLREIEIIMPGGICEGDPFVHVNSAPDCGTRRFLSFAGYSHSIVFYPVFLERLRAFSVLRFMDWMKTNGEPNSSPVSNWSQRTPLSYRTWAKESGAPVEIMIALANRVAAHPWFNMPHASDDTYAQNFAQTVKARLDPALGVYTEYSNEVWNAIFRQSAYAAAQGAAQVPPIDGMQYHALRSRTVGRLFENVLGVQRVVVVLAAQATNAWTATHGLEYLKNRFGSSTTGINAVAIAPYFSVTPDPSTASTYTSMTLDAFFDHVRAVVLPSATTAMVNYRTIASIYGVKLISYEGGQHMAGIRGAQNDAVLSTLFHAFNRDRRIKQVYLDYLVNWKYAGGELFVHYTDVGRYDKWGAWGALEYIAQPRATAPKFDALQSFIEGNPVWWLQ
jgi:hypothetical protein